MIIAKGENFAKRPAADDPSPPGDLPVERLIQILYLELVECFSTLVQATETSCEYVVFFRDHLAYFPALLLLRNNPAHVAQ